MIKKSKGPPDTEKFEKLRCFRSDATATADFTRDSQRRECVKCGCVLPPKLLLRFKFK